MSDLLTLDPAVAAAVDRLLEQTGTEASQTIPILQAIQKEFRHLPPAALRYVSARTGIPPADLEGVSSFYHQFRHKPMGEHSVRVCHGTACHVKGAPKVTDSLREHLHIAAGDDTDADQRFTVENVFCVGCCSLAPVVQVGENTYGHISYQTAPGVLDEYLRARSAQPPNTSRNGRPPRPPARIQGRLGICLDSCCVARGTADVRRAVEALVVEDRLPVELLRLSCALICEEMPMLEVHLPGQAPIRYVRVKPHEVRDIVYRHFRPPHWFQRLGAAVRGVAADLATGEVWDPLRHDPLAAREPRVQAFYGPQKHIATEHYGAFDPLDLAACRAHDGFVALEQALRANQPEETIAAVTASGLRGRGGAGFPTGKKWGVVREAPGDPKYVICNGDEGDPGAFMDRMLMESFPFRVIEGMTLGAHAVGAHEGIVYVRAEYPYAVQRLREAIRILGEHNLLGANILGSGFDFHLRVFEGAGAFVCGEETALIESIEGKRGIPRLKPPFPAHCGLWQKPTLINNVETWTQVPWILRHGGAAFAALGTARSKGTKVFALAGKVQRPGLIEVPMGITIQQIVDEIGGGVPEGRRLKAVQIGGPSGGCLPARLAHTPVDYEALVGAGAIMGSGGLVVLDDSDCMVDMARYFLAFMQNESCGKCTFCRIGTLRMREILDRLCAGEGKLKDLDELERLGRLTIDGSICGLGRTAPNPVLTTLRYFREEYEAHLQGRCPAGVCKKLVHYRVTADCTGCTICSQQCPVDAIPCVPYRQHVILDDKCTRCDTCRVVCPAHAIVVE